ncbi:hypothetical protein A7D17_05200 [Xanthomonas floridensis]|uniref:Uncharacterized protein n=1 Tax=Xanthomonas floridensis TaxID=1843580 RepID=A0A1A9M8E9_9XANT|nr:hypothetical protein A7D17_05200 [Xanthomonas floridensis]
MQHNDARNTLKHLDHVDVILGVTELIDDSVITRPVKFEPGEITYASRASDSRVIDMRLRHDHINFVMSCELRNQVRTIVRNTASLWGKRRNISETRSRARRRSRARLLHCGDGADCTCIPGKLRSLARSMLQETLPKWLINQTLMHLFHDCIFVARVKKRIFQTNHFGQTRCARADDWRPTLHRFESW